MKKQILKVIGGVSLAVLMLAIFAQVWVLAEDKRSESLPNGNELSIVGSWDVRVTIRDCQSGAALANFPAMITFNHGGTMQETANDAAPLLRLPGHGAWSQHNGRIYTAAFRFFRFNADGTFAGKNIIRQVDTLAQSGNEYSTTDTVEVLDANDNLIVRACATSTATRFQ